MVKDFSKMFVRGALKVPEAKFLGARFRAAPKFRGPPRLLLSGYCTPVENQGAKPWCAAYSASSYAENILWRVKGYREEIDPAPVYAHAKRIDGAPDGDGTYLECALDALLEQGLFDRNVSKVKTFGGRMFGSDTALDDLKYAVHRYGVCVAGFNITSEWFDPKGDVIRGERAARQGGHAVTVCGYDETGVLILNSWGADYARNGFVYLSNKAFDDQFMYGALLTHVLDEKGE